MELLKKKSIAVLVMALVVLVSLILAAKMPIVEAGIVLLVLLTVFTLIDCITSAKFLTERQAQAAAIILGLIAIAGIGIWGAFAGSGTSIEGGETPEPGNAPTAAVTDETYDLGLFYFERGDYEEAIQALNKVASTSGFYAEAQKLLVTATDQYRTGLMDTANTYVEKDDYKLAIEILKAGLLVIPEDVKLIQTIDDYSAEYKNAVRSAAIADAEAYAAEQDYANAMTVILNASDEIGSDTELDVLLDKYAGEYINFALTRADIIFNSEGYEAAIQFLREVQKLIISDSELSNAIAEYESHKPVSLDTLEIWQHGDFTCGPYTHETVTDNYGNVYNSFYSGSDGWNSQILRWQESYNVYKIDGEYSTLSGVFCIKKEYNSSDSQNYLYIYGDNVLLETYTVRGGDEPVKFSIDISGVSLLKIQPDSVRGYGGEEISFAANMYVAK